MQDDAYYVTRPDYNPKKSWKGARWQTIIIGRLWTQWFILWESRNKDVHGADAKQSTEAERRNTERASNAAGFIRSQESLRTFGTGTTDEGHQRPLYAIYMEYKVLDHYQ